MQMRHYPKLTEAAPRCGIAVNFDQLRNESESSIQAERSSVVESRVDE